MFNDTSICRLSAQSFQRSSNTGSASFLPAARHWEQKVDWSIRTSEDTPRHLVCVQTHIIALHKHYHSAYRWVLAYFQYPKFGLNNHAVYFCMKWNTEFMTATYEYLNYIKVKVVAWKNRWSQYIALSLQSTKLTVRKKDFKHLCHFGKPSTFSSACGAKVILSRIVHVLKQSEHFSSLSCSLAREKLLLSKT